MGSMEELASRIWTRLGARQENQAAVYLYVDIVSTLFGKCAYPKMDQSRSSRCHRPITTFYTDKIIVARQELVKPH